MKEEEPGVREVSTWPLPSSKGAVFPERGPEAAAGGMGSCLGMGLLDGLGRGDFSEG